MRDNAKPRISPLSLPKLKDKRWGLNARDNEGQRGDQNIIRTQYLSLGSKARDKSRDNEGRRGDHNIAILAQGRRLGTKPPGTMKDNVRTIISAVNSLTLTKLRDKI